MGSICNEANNKRNEKDKEKKNNYEKHKELRKKLFPINNINNNKLTCNNCYHISEIKEIHFDKQKIVIFCPKHGRKTIEIINYFRDIKNLFQKSVKIVVKIIILFMILKRKIIEMY